MTKIIGIVVPGKQKGRQLGFPTANIEIDVELDSGIYAGNITVEEKKYNCAVYYAGEKIVEAFIFDFSGDLYGKEVCVEAIKKIRDKKVFKNEMEAGKQITNDILMIKKYLQK
jgi:riboflavin kinase/FMN adenylyltransferase